MTTQSRHFNSTWQNWSTLNFLNWPTSSGTIHKTKKLPKNRPKNCTRNPTRYSTKNLSKNRTKNHTQNAPKILIEIVCTSKQYNCTKTVTYEWVSRWVNRRANKVSVQWVKSLWGDYGIFQLNHFGAITAFFRDWAPRTLTGGAERKVYAQRISVLGAQSQKNTAPKWYNSLDSNFKGKP